MKNVFHTYGRMLLRMTVLMTIALIGLSGCAWGSKKAIIAVETMTLTVRGMRGGEVYEFINDGGNTELRLYREVYTGEETVLELESSTACDKQTMAELMNTCGVMRWDGFHGKHPKNVADGEMFSFTATVNGGQTIVADGSAKFPKGYHDFVRALNAMLAESDHQAET